MTDIRPPEPGPADDAPPKQLTIQDCLNVLAGAMTAPIHMPGTETRVAAADSILRWQAHRQRLAFDEAMLAAAQGGPGGDSGIVVPRLHPS